MSLASALMRRPVTLPEAHPNELDLQRIRRTIEDRSRYRYVRPEVTPTAEGYLIRSACCSRKIDPSGGEIDIALIRWDHGNSEWSLLRKDHPTGIWTEDSRYARLPELLLQINSDPEKRFWQ